MNALDISVLRARCASLVASGNFEEAELGYRNILTTAPNDIHALVGLGNAARAGGDFHRAEDHYKSAARAHPKNLWPLFSLVDLYAKAGRWDDGEAAAQAAFAISPVSFHTSSALGRLRRARGDANGALLAFQAAAAAELDNVYAQIEVGTALAAVGRIEEAMAWHRTTLGRLPPEQHAAVLRAVILLARNVGDRPAALASLERMIALAPDDQKLRGEYAEELLGIATQNNPGSPPLSALEEAHRVAPRHVPTMVRLATEYLRAGDSRHPEAENLLKAALQQEPGDLRALLGLGDLAKHSGDHNAALEFFTRAQQLNPRSSWARIEAGRALMAAGTLETAEQLLKSVPEGDRHYRDALLALSDVARARGKQRSALEFLAQAAELSEQIDASLVTVIEEAIRHRELDVAESVAALLSTRSPKSVEAYMANGWILRARNQPVEALEAFSAAAKQGPSRAAPLIEMAAEYAAAGQTREAESCLMRAIEIEPDHLQALLRLSDRARARFDDHLALQYCERAQRAHPHQPWPYLAGAQILCDIGKIDAARDALTAGRKQCGDRAAFVAREGNLLQAVGMSDAAAGILSAGLSAFPADIWIWESLASVLTGLGEFEQVRKLVDEAPGHTASDRARVLFVAARLAEGQWKLEEASDLFEQVIELDPSNAFATLDRAKIALFKFDLAETKVWLQRHLELQPAATRRSITQSQIGQIFDEFSLAPNIADRLRILMQHPTPDAVVQCVEILADNPDSTAAAIALLILLRRTGALSAKLGETSLESIIPRTIIQYWDTAAVPDDVRGMMEEWSELNPGWSHTVYNASSAAAYLAKRGQKEALRAFQRTRNKTQQADLFRLARLYSEGGVYVDADDRCRGAMDRVLPRDRSLVIFQEDYGSIGNNFIAAAPNNPIVGRALEQAIISVLRGDMEIVWLSTGPGLLTRSLAETVSRQGADGIYENLSRVAVLDGHQLRQFLVPYCHAAYKRTTRHWINSAFRPK